MFNSIDSRFVRRNLLKTLFYLIYASNRCFFNHLKVSKTRQSDPFAPQCFPSLPNTGQLLTLSGGRSSAIRVLKSNNVLNFSKFGEVTDSMTVQDVLDKVYRPRHFRSVGDLKELALDGNGK